MFSVPSTTQKRKFEDLDDDKRRARVQAPHGEPIKECWSSSASTQLETEGRKLSAISIKRIKDMVARGKEYMARKKAAKIDWDLVDKSLSDAWGVTISTHGAKPLDQRSPEMPAVALRPDDIPALPRTRTSSSMVAELKYEGNAPTNAGEPISCLNSSASASASTSSTTSTGATSTGATSTGTSANKSSRGSSRASSRASSASSASDSVLKASTYGSKKVGSSKGKVKKRVRTREVKRCDQEAVPNSGSRNVDVDNPTHKRLDLYYLAYFRNKYYIEKCEKELRRKVSKIGINGGDTGIDGKDFDDDEAESHGEYYGGAHAGEVHILDLTQEMKEAKVLSSQRD